MYEDGNNTTHGGGFSQKLDGCRSGEFCAHPPELRPRQRVEVQYCMPIVFQVLTVFFEAVKGESPYTVTQDGRTYSGVAISHKTKFGREPVEP
ncbi:MAG: hypothetical protein R2877_02875 [Bdellovibrionota bacterium]